MREGELTEILRNRPGTSVRAIIAADGDRLPPTLTEEQHPALGDADIDYGCYTSAAYFEREKRDLWPRIWQWACREEHIPEPGDYYVYDIVGHSLLIVRDEDGSVKALRNSCTHRATQLRPPGTMGSANDFRCPFHRWRFGLDGTLTDLPCRWDFPHLGQQHDLMRVRCERWGGFIFINLDPDAPPLAHFLDPLPEHFKGHWDLSDRVISLHLQKELPTNWKAAAEAFLETYHVMETHPQMLLYLNGETAQYDIFGPNVSRFVNARGVPGPGFAAQVTEERILRGMPGKFDGVAVAPGGTARATAAAAIRDRLRESADLDLSNHSVSEILDNFQYFLFPNAFLFAGVAVSPVYRFRPLSIGRTLMDVLFLRLKAPGEQLADPPEPMRFGEDESFSTIPDFDPVIALAFDQDIGNMRAQWNGFHATGKPGETLGRYQEMLIRNFHATLDTYLGPSPVGESR